MPSFVYRSSAFGDQAASGGARLVSSTRPIANKAFAMNGPAYGSPEKLAHYLDKAKGGSALRSFPGHGANQTDFYGVPNGGILKPEDTGIWRGTLFRVAYAQPKAPESQVVKVGVGGEWWIERETFIGIAQKAGTPNELLEHLRAELALGRELKMDTTKIISVSINGPVAAYMGRGNPTSHNYEAAEFPMLYGNPFVKQLFIPGIRDLDNKTDESIVESVFDVGSTNSYDAVGALARFGAA